MRHGALDAINVTVQASTGAKRAQHDSQSQGRHQTPVAASESCSRAACHAQHDRHSMTASSKARCHRMQVRCVLWAGHSRAARRPAFTISQGRNRREIQRKIQRSKGSNKTIHLGGSASTSACCTLGKVRLSRASLDNKPRTPPTRKETRHTTRLGGSASTSACCTLVRLSSVRASTSCFSVSIASRPRPTYPYCTKLK